MDGLPGELLQGIERRASSGDRRQEGQKLLSGDDLARSSCGNLERRGDPHFGYAEGEQWGMV